MASLFRPFVVAFMSLFAKLRFSFSNKKKVVLFERSFKLLLCKFCFLLVIFFFFGIIF